MGSQKSKTARIASLILVLGILFGMLPTGVSAAGETVSQIYILGDTVDLINRTPLPLGEGKATYEPDTNTLKLENATIQLGDPSYTHSDGIYAIGNITVELVGDNRIVPLNQNDINCYAKNGISVNSGSLDIIGTGSLSISIGRAGSYGNTRYALKAHKHISIQDASITLTDLSPSDHHDYEVDGNLIGIDGAANEDPALPSVLIDNATVTVDGFDTAITGDKTSVTIKDSQVTARGLYMDAIAAAVYPADIIVDNSTLDVTSLNSAAMFSSSGRIKIQGDDSSVTANGNYAAFEGGAGIEITGGTVIATSKDASAFYTPGQIKIDGAQTNVTATAKYRGLQADQGILLTGGTVRATSTNDAAVWAKAASAFSGSSLTATGVNFGILLENGLTIDSGTVTAQADVTKANSHGIYNKLGDLSITGGITTAKGGASAITLKDTAGSLLVGEGAFLQGSAAQTGALTEAVVSADKKTLVQETDSSTSVQSIITFSKSKVIVHVKDLDSQVVSGLTDIKLKTGGTNGIVKYSTFTSPAAGTYVFDKVAPGTYSVVASRTDKTVTGAAVVTLDLDTETTLVLPNTSQGDLNSIVKEPATETDAVIPQEIAADLSGAFSDEDKALATAGSKVELQLDTAAKKTDGSTLADAQKTAFNAIKTVVKENTDNIKMLLDFSLQKITTPSGGSSTIEALTSLPGVVTISFDLSNLPASNLSRCKVLRYHDGKVDTLEKIDPAANREGFWFSSDGKILNVKTQKFSLYALCDVPADPAPPVSGGSAPVTGWILDRRTGKMRLADEKGRYVTGWAMVDSKWYYLDQEQYRVYDWQLIDGKWYYLEPETGIMQTGWKSIRGNWYYMASSGSMQTGWQKVGGSWYSLAPSGAMQTGWQKINGSWYYLAPSGAMQTGWRKINGSWYSLSSSGAMRTGWFLDTDGKWYFLNANGKMATGWFLENGSDYYLNIGGVMIANRWYQVDGRFYYFYPSGRMAHNTAIDGYRVDSNGAWIR